MTTTTVQATTLSLEPLLLSRSERKRGRSYSNETTFAKIQEVFKAIQSQSLKLEHDTKILVHNDEGLAGKRDERPFVLTYSEQDVIGEGGYGVVYKGKIYKNLTNSNDYFDVAIKVPQDLEAHEEFVWEIEVHQMLRPIPRIQQLLLTYDLGLVSALRPGTSRLIVTKNFEVKNSMFRDLVKSHQEMLKAGFYYTDNKPENFLLNGSELEIVDLSAACHLPEISKEEWKPSMFNKIYDPVNRELLLSRDTKYIHDDLWNQLKSAPKKSYQHYKDFKKSVEHLIVYSLLITYFELMTNELPNDNPNRSICQKNPIRENALDLLIGANCPEDKAKQLVEYLCQKSLSSMMDLLDFLA
jgi:serine/threonine protein kinase